MAKFRVVEGAVEIDKEPNKLDEFALDVLGIVKRFTDYVIISGYVSIFFGRARATEDIDIFIRPMTRQRFREMYDAFVAKGYEWTVDGADTLFEEYLQQNTPVSVWRKGFPLLRMEMKFATKPDQRVAFEDRITVKFKGREFLMASIESQIAYKRYIAKSEKDLADARHLELVFEGLNQAKIERYRMLFEAEFHGRR